MKKNNVLIGILAGVCLALALAACQPGGSPTGSNGAASTPAPINVPQGYQGIVQITFSATTTYDEAVSILQSAGMKLQVQCPNPGPIVGDPTVTPRPINQQATFASTQQLSAIGTPNLTQAMLNQVAASAQVTSIDKAPQMACPLLSAA